MGFRNGKPSKQFTAIPNSLIRDHNLTDSTFRFAAESFEKSEQPNEEIRVLPSQTPSDSPANSSLPKASIDPYKKAQNVKELIDAWLTDPTAFADDCVPLKVRDSIKWNRWVLPWRNGERKLNNLYQNFNPIVVDFLAAELATKSKLSAQQEITHAVAVMNTWEKNKGGWTNLMQRLSQAHSAETQRLAQQQAIQTAHAAPNELRAVLPEIRQARRFTKVA